VGSLVNASVALLCGQSLTLLVWAGGEDRATEAAALCSRLSKCKSLKQMDEALVHRKSLSVGKNTGWFAE